METELTPELFFSVLSEAQESGALDRYYYNTGTYEGKPFVIVEGHSTLNAITTYINGYRGNLEVASDYERKDLNERLNKAIEQLDVELVKNPTHLGTHSRLESEIKKLSNTSAYLRWLYENEVEEKSIEDFEVEYGFSDEYDLCGHCQNEVVRTSPDSYCWTAPLYVESQGWVCDNCAGEYADYILEEFCNVEKNIPDQFSTSDLGLVKINKDSYQNGLHYGMDDSPKPIIEKLNNEGIDVWFKVQPSQFYCEFDVYVKEADEDKATAILDGTDTYQGFSSAGNCEKALKAASKAMGELNGEGIKYAKINSDGTADVRLVSNEEFVKGVK